MTTNGDECVPFTYREQTIGSNFCKHDRITKSSWCATKLDAENNIAEFGDCEIPSEDCQELKCHMKSDGTELTPFVTESKQNIYFYSSPQPLTFEQAEKYCYSEQFSNIGTSIAKVNKPNYEQLFAMNYALYRSNKTAPFWVGYRALDGKLYFLEQSSSNADLTNQFDYDIDKVFTDGCVSASGQKHKFWDSLLSEFTSELPTPEFDVVDCSKKLPVLCVKTCLGLYFSNYFCI